MGLYLGPRQDPIGFCRPKDEDRPLRVHGLASRVPFPVAEDVFGDEEWTFQRDGAPAHKAIETQDFLRDNCPDVITVDPHWQNPTGEWPPNSPDLNLLNYFVWSILEEKACQKPHPNVESLKKAWKEITLVKIAYNFPKRLKACIDARGGHFE